MLLVMLKNLHTLACLNLTMAQQKRDKKYKSSKDGENYQNL